jgi:hypothetical protein
MWIDAMNVRDGVDAAFDPLGFKSFDESYSILRKGGILVGYGLNLPGLSGSKPPSVLPAIVKLLARELAVLVRETNDIFWRNPFIETLHPGSGAAIRVACSRQDIRADQGYLKRSKHLAHLRVMALVDRCI